MADGAAIPAWWPVLGVAGFSGSGKTTLLEAVIPRLLARGWRVAVLKHDAHALDVDRDGKDSARLFAAGASVVVQSGAERFSRTHDGASDSLPDLLRPLVAAHDVVLVEGFKSAPGVPRVWLENDAARAEPMPLDVAPLATIARNADRPAMLMQLLDDHLQRAHQARPVFGAVLIGGASLRMGEPKHLLRRPDGTTLVEHAVRELQTVATRVVLLGAGEVPASLAATPRLPDIADGREGPLAGVLAALRWQPDAWWCVAPCDQPALGRELLTWLREQAATSVWAVAASIDGQAQPLPMLLDGRLRDVAGSLWQRGGRERSLRALLQAAPGARITPLPDELRAQMRSVNTPAEWRGL
ncbi:MAG: molybdopterin-guanine dinucleotide biosynthesis protein B [Planctomycetota bacterium]